MLASEALLAHGAIMLKHFADRESSTTVAQITNCNFPEDEIMELPQIAGVLSMSGCDSCEALKAFSASRTTLLGEFHAMSSNPPHWTNLGPEYAQCTAVGVPCKTIWFMEGYT